MIQPLLHPDFNPSGVRYGFFGRKGGVSEGVYASLNCRIGSKDSLDHAQENRARVSEYFGSRDTLINTIYQIHSGTPIVIDENLQGNRPQGDALVTKEKGLLIGVMTADCTPVLFHAKTAEGAPMIAAAHAGWRGATSGILDNTILEMQRLGATAESMTACIGPCIAQDSYEVDQRFYETFIAEDRANITFFVENKDNAFHYWFNLPGYCAHRLKAAGVKTIHDVKTDTYRNDQDYFSYRRATHHNESDYGGQMSAIMIAG